MGSIDRGIQLFISLAAKQIATWIDNGTSPKKAIDETFGTNFDKSQKTSQKDEEKKPKRK